MTLSKYERRVLEQIEAEFRAARTHWWASRRLRALLCVLVGVAACVVVAVFVPSPAAAMITAAFGAVTAWAAMLFLRR